MLFEHISNRQWGFIAVVQGLIALIVVGLWSLLSIQALIIGIVLECALILAVILGASRRLEIEIHRLINDARSAIGASAEQEIAQMQATVGLYTILTPHLPLPAMGGWAATADLLGVIVSEVYRIRPKLVVEASSGVSTVVIAYALKKIGQGRVVALDHDEEFANKTRATIAQHGLQDIVEVVHAPLVEYHIEGETYEWYDLSKGDLSGGIEMLVVDGPPKNTGRLARYPAVPLLEGYFREEAIVFLDDGDRPDERESAQRWGRRASAIAVEYLSLTKGAWRLEFRR